MSEIFAIQAGSSEMNEPDPHPNTILNAIVVPGVSINQSTNIETMTIATLTMIVLKQPYRSPMKPHPTRARTLFTVISVSVYKPRGGFVIYLAAFSAISW